MFGKQKLYHKVNKLRTNLLLFIDKEIQHNNKKCQNNNQTFFFPKKIKMEEKIVPIIEEGYYSYGTKENSSIIIDSPIQDEQQPKKLNKIKFESCHLFTTYCKNPISDRICRSSNRLEIQNENYGKTKDKLIFRFKTKKYELKKFCTRDKVICFEEINNNKKKDEKYYKKYLKKLAKNVKKGNDNEKMNLNF